MYENLTERLQAGFFAETAFTAQQVAETRLAEVEKGIANEPCAFIGRPGNADPGQR